MYDRDYVSSGFSMNEIYDTSDIGLWKNRTLYFENNVDIRLCHKNGNTTLKSIWSQLYYNVEDHHLTIPLREELQKKNKLSSNIDIDRYGFRKGSYRIAIKRDPIERALSAAKEVIGASFYVYDPSIDIIEEFFLNFDLNVEKYILSNSIEFNYHFLSQTFSMGVASDYDKVYDIRDLDKLVRWLEETSDYPYKITNRYLNKSKSELKVSDLSPKVIDKLYTTYEIDYKNGWF
jgi:hypothetical protein